MSRRNCCAVITEMMFKIPKSEEEFLKDLQWNWEDASYKAPEEVLQWHRTQATLMKHIPKPTQDWEFEVLCIFTTKTRTELEELFKEYSENNTHANKNEEE
jgi:hypothetical protein